MKTKNNLYLRSPEAYKKEHLLISVNGQSSLINTHIQKKSYTICSWFCNEYPLFHAILKWQKKSQPTTNQMKTFSKHKNFQYV